MVKHNEKINNMAFDDQSYSCKQKSITSNINMSNFYGLYPKFLELYLFYFFDFDRKRVDRRTVGAHLLSSESISCLAFCG